MSCISQKHISKGRGPAPAVWISEDDYCLSLLFPALLVSCLELIPQGSSSLFLTTQTIFHTNPRLLVPRPQNYMETLTKMCWLRKFAEVRLRSSCPLLSVLLHFQAADTCLPIPAASLQMGSGKRWRRYVGVHVRNVFPFEDRRHYLGSGAESWRQIHLPGFITSTCKAAPSPEGQGG